MKRKQNLDLRIFQPGVEERLLVLTCRREEVSGKAKCVQCSLLYSAFTVQLLFDDVLQARYPDRNM